MGYLVALVGVLLAGSSPWWLTPLTEDTPPMRLMLVVVVGISAWLGGLGPGLFATAIGLVAIIEANDTPSDLTSLSWRLGRFGSLALLISVLFEWLHISQHRPRSRSKSFAEVKADTGV